MQELSMPEEQQQQKKLKELCELYKTITFLPI